MNAFGGGRADRLSSALSADTNKNIMRGTADLMADAFTDATGRIKDAASGIAGALSGQASGLSQLQQVHWNNKVSSCLMWAQKNRPKIKLFWTLRG